MPIMEFGGAGSGSGEILHNLLKTGCNMQAQKAEQRTNY